MGKRAKVDKREIRIFVSSTFQDLHAERDYIIRRTFPRLQDYCRKRGIQFTGVDLRWGITSSQAEEGKTIKLCLDEIKRCEPYFINIIGQRYGWVPTREDLVKDEALTVDYEDLINFSMDNAISITEMEIVEGVFNQKKEVKAFFFLGDDEVYKQKNEAMGIAQEDQDAKEKLIKLREKIIKSGYPTFENFTSPEQLGQVVYESLKDAIDRQFPLDAALSEVEEEERKHQAFALTRKDYYLNRTETEETVMGCLLEHSKPVVLMGESGTGKSAFLANFVDIFEEKHSYHIIEHYVGADSSKETDILRHILLSLGAYDRLRPNERGRFHLMLSVLKDVLQERDEPILIAIDAYNQVSDTFSGFDWLRELVNPRVAILVTSTPSEYARSLEKDRWDTIILKPFEPEAIKEIVQSVLKIHGKTIEAEILDKLVQNQKHLDKLGIIKSVILSVNYGELAGHLGNALFLRVLLNELIVASKHETLSERIDYYLDAMNIQELLNLVLDRLEHEFGEDVVRFLMGHLCVSRHGFSEQELRLLAMEKGIAYLNLVECIDNLSTHLMKREDRLDFFHKHIEAAARQRYLKDDHQVEAIKQNIIAVFKTLPMTDAHLEIIYQLYTLKDAKTMAVYLSTWEVFQLFYEKNYYELNLYLRYCETEGYSIIDQLYVAGAKTAKQMLIIAKLMYQVRRYDIAKEIIDRLIFEMKFEAFDVDERLYAKRLMVAIMLKQGNIQEAIDLTKEQIEALTHEGDENEMAKSQLNLGHCYMALKAYPHAKDAFACAQHGLDSRLNLRAEEMFIRASVSLEKQAPLESNSFQMLEKILQQKSALYGSMSKEVCESLLAMAAFKEANKDNEGAKQNREEALAILQKNYGDVHLEVGDLHLLLDQNLEGFINKLTILGAHHHETMAALDKYKDSLDNYTLKDKLLISFLNHVKQKNAFPRIETLDDVMKKKFKRRNKKMKRDVLFNFKYLHLYLVLSMVLMPTALMGYSKLLFIGFLIILGLLNGIAKKRGSLLEVSLFSLLPVILSYISTLPNKLINVYAVFWLGNSSLGAYKTFVRYLSEQDFVLIQRIVTQEGSFLRVGLERFIMFAVAYGLGRIIGVFLQQDKVLRKMLLLEGSAHD